MIRRGCLLLLLAAPLAAAAEPSPPAEPAQPPPEEDASLERYRTPFEVLSERMIGSASRAVRFDWRRSTVSLGVVGSQLLEYNNFGSTRVGGFVRTPLAGVWGELAVTRVFSWGTDSTRKLALTPYRQLGRPSRFELDLNFGYPLAEGVGTAQPGFFPATELVFSATAGLRYLYYPGSLDGANFGEVARTVLAPRLSDRELENLERDRPPGMQVDSGRYGVLAGFALDLYFQTGGFVAPRVMVALPVLSTFNGSGLGWWWELSLSGGWAF